MINGMWQGQLLDADEVAKREQIDGFETLVRKASDNRELRCTDPECEFPTLCYKHGPKRAPHFAHIVNSECDYARFERQDTQTIKSIRTALYNHFVGLGYSVEREIKIPKGRKYCHIIIKQNNKPIVVQIASSTTSATYIGEFTKECEDSGYKLLWIAVGNTNDVHREKHHYHAMRYQFNHTTNKNLLIIAPDATMVSQIKEDNTRYEYKGQLLNYRYFSEDVNNFQIVRPVSELRIVDGELTIDSFSDEYNAWIDRKQAAFSKMKATIDAEEVHRSEAEKLRAKQFEEARKRQLQKQKFTMTRQNNDRNSARSTPLIPYKQGGVVSRVFSDYKIGTKVLHSKYGYGVIVNTSINATTAKHEIEVRYDGGNQHTQELEILFAAGTISIVE